MLAVYKMCLVQEGGCVHLFMRPLLVQVGYLDDTHRTIDPQVVVQVLPGRHRRYFSKVLKKYVIQIAPIGLRRFVRIEQHFMSIYPF